MNATRGVAVSFVISVLASIGLVVTYLLGGDPQVEGVLLALALGGIGVGIVVWAIRLIEAPIISEERHSLASTREERALATGAADIQSITRRSFLVRLLVGSVAAITAALAIPALSLGPRPGRALFQTPWREGARVVTVDGAPIRPAELGFGTVRTVYPDYAIGSADAATLLIRVEPSLLQLDEVPATWTQEGCVGYSKICTHAGCPVGLYRDQDHSLLCPCHQSTFDVLRGAVPTFGPAARPLPQLPLGVDDEGYLVALSDFPAPVGPSFWNLTHQGDPALLEDADVVD